MNPTFEGHGIMKRQFRVALLCAFPVLSLPARAQDANSKPSLDGCVLLAGSDAESIIGEKLKRNPRAKYLQMLDVESFGCNYKSDKWTVEVRLERGRTAEGVQGYLKTLKGVVKQTTQSDARQVRGLGDDAWWGPISPTNGILTVARKTDVLWIQTYGDGTGAGSLEKTKALMEKVLANYERLPKK
jgi:hypothetical protein